MIYCQNAPPDVSTPNILINYLEGKDKIYILSIIYFYLDVNYINPFGGTFTILRQFCWLKKKEPTTTSWLVS